VATKIKKKQIRDNKNKKNKFVTTKIKETIVNNNQSEQHRNLRMNNREPSKTGPDRIFTT